MKSSTQIAGWISTENREDGSRSKRLVNTTGLLLCCLFAAATAQAQGNSDNVRALNARILQFHGALHGADAGQAAQIRAESAPVFAQRSAALKALIREDPKAALGLAFSKDLIDDLAEKFPNSVGLLEKHGSWQGQSEHIIADDPARKIRQFQVQIHAGNETLQVYSAEGEPHCISGNTLSATGVRVENLVAAASTSVQGSAATAGCSTLGAQNLAILLVQFPTIPLPGVTTPSSVSDIFFASSGQSVDNYWREASYGKASATGNVFGPYTLDRTYGCNEANAMLTAAIAAADPFVYFPSYTRIFVVFPYPGACYFAGLGTLGCYSYSSADGNFTASISWLVAEDMPNRDAGVKLATHEGGHNLTLHHSSSRSYTGEALGPLSDAGTLMEYGDNFATMGYWNLGHYAAPHKVQMGWLSLSNVITAETNGNYNILPYETATSGVQAVKVRRGSGNDAWLWVEYRQPLGQFDSTLSGIFSGGLIHYQDLTSGTHTHLLDFTPLTSGFWEPTLTGAWTDPYTNVSVSVTGATSSALSLSVKYGGQPCSAVQPTVTLSPPNPSVNSGSAVSYTMSVKNNDTAGCTASTFVLGSTSSWSTSLSSGTLTLNPGQTGTATLTKSVPSGTIPGTYGVNATASDAIHSAAGTANVTITAPSMLQVTLSAAPAVVNVRDTVTIQATVTNAGAPVSGASVTLTVLRSNGTEVATATTNASGVATLQYKAQWKTGYSVTAAATWNGATVTSSPATFTAQ